MPHNVSADRIVGAWEAPSRGVLRNIPAHRLPPEALYDAKNVVYEDGHLAARPGLLGYTNDGVVARPVGLVNVASLARPAFQAPRAFQASAFQTTAETDYLVAITHQKVWARWRGSWHDLMGGSIGVFQANAFQTNAFQQNAATNPLSGAADNLGRFAAMQISSDTAGNGIYVMAVNGKDTPRVWDTRTNLVTVATGWSKFSDVIHVEARFVGIEPPFAVRWGESLSIATPSGLNVRFLSETTDRVVAITNLGLLGFVVFKEEHIWIAQAQGGPSSSFFRFQPYGKFSGPASAGAVVNYDGLICYMTPTGRIGIFDGSRHRWVADGAWVQIRDGVSGRYPKIDKTNSRRIFGVVHPFRSEVWFFFPQDGDGGDLYGVVILTLPDAEAGIDHFGAFPGRLSVPVSAGASREGILQDAVVMRSNAPYTAFTLDGTLDVSFPITGHWRTGLAGAPGIEPHRMEGHESFFERDTNLGSLTVRPLSSYVLDRPGGTEGSQVSIDLTRTPVKDEKGGDARGRFFGLLYEFSTATSTPRWSGARLAARRIEHSPGLTTARQRE